MSLNVAVDVLRDMPLFREVDPKRLRVIAMMADAQTYRSGERLFEQGDEGDAAYIVLSGAADVLLAVGGRETAISQLSRGEIFGELAVLCDTPRSSAIAANGDLSVLRLDRTTVMNLLKEFPDVTLQLARIIGTRLERTTRQLAEARTS